MTPDRRAVLTGVGCALIGSAARAGSGDELELTGRFVQGGHAIGRAWPGAVIRVDGEAMTTAGPTGAFIVGFDRDAGPRTVVEARYGARSARRVVAVAPGIFPSTRVDGLPPSTVEPSDPALLARIAREAELKAAAFASRLDAEHFRAGFDWPLTAFRVSSEWGSQRILNGTPARPHYGIDLAAPAGTPIHAPADGRVVLAEPDLHFEGGLILIDHGQGLVSACLHQSALVAALGRDVKRGEVVGRVGMTGRATGPHLCWRLKWRDRNLDPSLLVRSGRPPAP